MIEMTLPDMTCGHCASVVSKTCTQVDPKAKFEVDLGTKTIKIESTSDRAIFAEALCEAGYPPAQ